MAKKTPGIYNIKPKKDRYIVVILLFIKLNIGLEFTFRTHY